MTIQENPSYMLDWYKPIDAFLIFISSIFRLGKQSFFHKKDTSSCVIVLPVLTNITFSNIIHNIFKIEQHMYVYGNAL